MMDTRMLKKRQEFKELRDAYVIFICQHDKFGDGEPVYHIDKVIRENGEPYNDGAYTIYVNGVYQGEDNIGKLAHDFNCKKADDIFYNPCHEYTKGLLRSIPTAGNEGQKLQPITGTPIDLLNMPKGCPFAPRCDAAMKICIREKCESFEISENHTAACWMNLKKAMDRK